MSSLSETSSRHHYPMGLAQASTAFTKRSLLTPSDIALVQSIQQEVVNSGEHDNPQNVSHHNPNHKHCTFLHKPCGASLPANPLRALAPQVLGKLLRFAQASWASSTWSSSSGPISSVSPPGTPSGGVGNLSLRVAEHWHYDVGGHLDNDRHYDQGSVLTIVTALNEDFTGGVFRTFEPSGEHAEHPLAPGDSLCIVSHKFHNVTPVLSGFRESLVLELWEGGITHGR
ncbi:hypothetical protein TeGR_g11266 [Tetraparma gracilis]|jgi:hypothetical protein|uniref:Fe2OG dioxygenase domain-containing protein n=1 Tax=Tetraparma gracilis TaxID=2962635 RepID=A0ABQ6N2L7_9STRA|nr:hypothetical protein TeGR_g11266 [Tetraparma gracilis]